MRFLLIILMVLPLSACVADESALSPEEQEWLDKAADDPFSQRNCVFDDRKGTMDCTK